MLQRLVELLVTPALGQRRLSEDSADSKVAACKLFNTSALGPLHDSLHKL
jgi:hypothetical protein